MAPRGYRQRAAGQVRVPERGRLPCNLLLGDSRDIFLEAGVACVRLSAPERDAPYDLVFSFCEFEQAGDATAFLESLDGFGSRFVLIVTQNWRNPGVPLHRLYHLLSRVPWDHGRLSKASDRAVLRAVRRGGFRWRLVERRCFDTPWFVLDVYETGRFLRRLVPERRERPLLRDGREPVRGAPVRRTLPGAPLPPTLQRDHDGPVPVA